MTENSTGREARISVPLPLENDESMTVGDTTVGIGDVLLVEGDRRVVVGIQGDFVIHYRPRTREFGYTIADVIEYELAGDGGAVIIRDADIESLLSE